MRGGETRRAKVGLPTVRHMRDVGQTPAEDTDRAQPPHPGAALTSAARLLTESVSHPDFLPKLVELASDLVGARYGALGLTSASGGRLLADFIPYGMDQDTATRIGTLPQGRGVLGILLADAAPVRIPDISADPRSVGFPAHHPRMRSFLGVPIVAEGEVYGNLYFADKIGAERFDDADEALAVAFAAHAGAAIRLRSAIEAADVRARELDSLNVQMRARNLELAARLRESRMVEQTAGLLITLRSPEQVRRSICDLLVEELGVTAAALLVPPNHGVQVAAAAGAARPLVGTVFRPDSAWAVASRTPATAVLRPSSADALEPFGAGTDSRVILAPVRRLADDRTSTLVVSTTDIGEATVREEVLETIGSLMGGALSLTRGYQRLSRTESYLETVLDLANRFVTADSLGALLDLAAAQAAQLVGATGAAIYLVDGNEFRLSGSAGLDGEPAWMPELASRAAEDMQARVWQESSGEAAPEDVLVSCPAADSVLAVPVVTRGACLGVIEVFGAEDRFGPEEEAGLRGLAVQVALGQQSLELRDRVRDLTLSEDRNRIAMDIHDGAIQELFAAGLLLESIPPDVGRPDIRAQVVDRLDCVIADLREYVHGLNRIPHADVVEDLGTLVEGYRSLTGATVDLVLEPAAATVLSPYLASARQIVREALVNAIKHGRPERISVEVHSEVAQPAPVVVIAVADDGAGFDPAEVPRGFGLGNLSRRAADLGGTCAIDSAPGKGTRVEVRLPTGSHAGALRN